MVERSPETTPRAPAAAARPSRLRSSFRPCNTTSWPWSIRSRAAMRPRPSDDPVMNTRATSYLLSSRRPFRLTIPNDLPASRVFPCTRHDAGEKVYAIQEEEGRPEKQHPQHSTEEALTPLQTAFRKHHALQCGFCTPGMLTTAHALLTDEPDADADRIRSALSGNLCRCTGYIPIIEAVLEARAAYRKADKP